MMDGRIWVESALNRGSIFYFIAKFGKATGLEDGSHVDQITRHSQNNHLSMKSEQPLRVLLAEDNPVNQQLAVELLKMRGHTVRVACNGIEVLDALGQEAFDIVLMDVQMPEMNGFQATAAIREEEKKT